MKRPSHAFRTRAQRQARRERDFKDTLETMTPEMALLYAGANEKLDLFHKILEQRPVDMALFEKEEHLITLIAHSGNDAAIWLANNSRRLGMSLDRQDTYEWDGGEDEHAPHFRFSDHIDCIDRLHWQQGPYLRNTALILSLKKGWDHVSDIGFSGNYSTKAEIAKKTKMGNVTAALLRNGANPNIQDGCGNTALHIAVLHRDVRSIHALKTAGARDDLRNNAGLRPIDMLDVRYDDINPFLYQQTGNDVNCYIFTLKPRKEWLRAGIEVRQALQGDGGLRPAAPGL